MSTENRHHLSEQEVINMTLDNTYDVIAIEMLGEDSGVLRRVAVDATGQVKITV